MSRHMVSEAHAAQRNTLRPSLTAAAFSPQRVHMNVNSMPVLITDDIGAKVRFL